MEEDFERVYRKMVEDKGLDERIAKRILKKILKILSVSKEKKK